MRLTARERVLLHLLEFSADAETAEVSLELTQEGIAQASWITLPHFAQYIRPLAREGFVQERLAHVRGVRQRRKVYDLTTSGKMAALRLREKLKSEVVSVRDSNGVRELAISDILSEAGERTTFLEIARQVVYTGRVDIESLSPPRGPAFVEMIADAPRLRRFIGRRAELKEVTQGEDRHRMFIVRGVAGIGKSSFAAKACELLRGQRNLFWHRVRPWETHQVILAGLGDFLLALGRPELRTILRQSEVRRAAAVLRQDLPGTRAFLVFDDAHEATSEALSTFRLLKDAVAEVPDVRVLFLTRHTLSFYDRRDVVLARLVREIDLPGLSADEVVAFLSNEPNAASLMGQAGELGGHPLFLELLQFAPDLAIRSFALHDVRRFIEEEIYLKLTEAERRMMKTASLYRVPVPREALFSDPTLVLDVFLSLTSRALIRPVGGESYEVHDTIREFFAEFLTSSEQQALHSFAIQQLRALAAAARGTRDFPRCVGYLSNALQLSSIAQERATLLEALGDTNERSGDIFATLAAYRESLKSSTERETVARLHRKISGAFMDRRDVESASAELDAGLETLGGARSAERGWLDLMRSRVAFFRVEGEEAREYGEAALRIFRDLNEVQGEAYALAHLGEVALSRPRPNPPLAESYFAQALALSASVDDPEFPARVHVGAIEPSFESGDVEKIESHIAAVEAMPEALRNPSLRREFLLFRGIVRSVLQADFEGAEADLSESIDLARKMRDSHGVASAKHGLAAVAFHRGFREGRLDQARHQLEEVVDMERALGLANDAVELMYPAAEVCLLQQDVDGFRRIIASLDDPKLSPGVSSQLGLVKLLSGLDRFVRGDDAGSLGIFAEVLRQETGFAAMEAHFLYAVALRVLGRQREAETHLGKAEELCRAFGRKNKLSILGERARRMAEALRHARSS